MAGPHCRGAPDREAECERQVGDFASFDAGTRRFDLVTFVAGLHQALCKARDLTNPGGEVAVVGLCANRSPFDWFWAGGCLPFVRRGLYYRYLLRWRHR